MFESIFQSGADMSITAQTLLLSLAVALALGMLASLTYRMTHASQSPSHGFSVTLALLPAIITVIILLVGNSVARAFSLAGAFSIIRFRSAPGNPKDITFVLLSMAIGLACGMGYPLYAALVAVILCAAFAALDFLRFGKPKSTAKLLKITIPENLDYDGAFDGVFKRYAASYALQKVKTVDLGSLYELVYTVTTRDDLREKDFIDELRCRNGNLNITLVLAPTPDEF